MNSTVPAKQDACDDALLSRLQAADAQAFEELVRQYGPRMLVAIRRLLDQEADAHDALQDAFASAFRGLPQFDGRSSLSTWLQRIAINAALMKLRTQRRKPTRSLDELLPVFGEDGHMHQPSQHWAAPTELAETRAVIRKHIDTLPDDYRTILVLRDLEEHTTEEVAQLLDITTSTVKTRLHRARQALKTLLDPHFHNGSL